MQIMCWVSNSIKALMVFLLLVGNISRGYAQTETVWLPSKGGKVHLKMADGSFYGVKLRANTKGVFYDRGKHVAEGQEFVSVFQVVPSNATTPEGVCGAGSEIWLYVYQVNGQTLSREVKTLVSSCLRSISLASQNNGTNAQDTDLSSVQWNLHGFSIEWFNNVDAVGRALQSSSFIWHGDAFLQHEVLSQETPKS